MANPFLVGDVESPHPYHTKAIGMASIAAAGAPTLVTKRQMGIFKAIVRTGVGAYNVNLTEAWQNDGSSSAPLQIVPTIQSPSFAASDGSIVHVNSEQIWNTGTPYFTLNTRRADTMALADPPAGSILIWGFEAMMVVP